MTETFKRKNMRKNIRRRFLLALVCVVLLLVPSSSAVTHQPIQVTVDGQALVFDVPPTIVEGRTLVPLRAIFEALGAEIEWDEATSTVTGRRGETWVVLSIGSHQATVNGALVDLEVPGTLVNGRTLVPARFIAESLGAQVDWSAENSTVNITRVPASSSTTSTDNQHALAQELYRQIAQLDDYDLEAIETLYYRVINEAPDTVEAQMSHWRLSNMYLRAYDTPRRDTAADILEKYRVRYPNSQLLNEEFGAFVQDGTCVVVNRLLSIYTDMEVYDKAAALYDEIIPDLPQVPEAMIDRLPQYAMTMEQVQRVEEAIQAYELYLEEKEAPQPWMVAFIQENLERLRRE